MKASQIVVRTTLIEELRSLQREGKGIRLGKFVIATKEEIESEINRRLDITRNGNRYLYLRTAGF